MYVTPRQVFRRRRCRHLYSTHWCSATGYFLLGGKLGKDDVEQLAPVSRSHHRHAPRASTAIPRSWRKKTRERKGGEKKAGKKKGAAYMNIPHGVHTRRTQYEFVCLEVCAGEQAFHSLIPKGWR